MADDAPNMVVDDAGEDPAEEKKTASEPASSGRRAGRVRKQVEFFNAGPVSQPTEVELYDGPGVALGKIANVERRIGATNAQANELKLLHRIFYRGVVPRKATTKANLRNFSGFRDVAESTKHAQALLQSQNKAQLKKVALVLDVDWGGSKEDLVDRIVSFLKSPEESGKAYRIIGKSGRLVIQKDKAKQGSKRKRSKSSKGGESDEDGSEEEADDDEAEDEEEKKPAKKKSKKKTKTPTTKQDSSDDEDDNEPLADKLKRQQLEEKMKASATRIIKEGNLTSLTFKDIKEKLSEEFGKESVKERKSWLKSFVTEAISGSS